MPNQIRIEILLFEGASAASAQMALELFELANTLFSRPAADGTPSDYVPFDPALVSPQTRDWRSGPTRLTLQKPARHTAAVFVPGIWYTSGRELLEKLEQQEAVLEWLRQRHAQGSIIASGCTGTTLLAAAGLLDEAPGTGCWWLADWYARRTPNAKFCLEKLLHCEDRIWTAAAGTAFYSLLIQMVEHFAGQERAAQLGRMMLVAPNEAPQAAFMSKPAISNIEDAVVARAQRWIARRLAQPIAIEELASACAVSPRTLTRRFKQVLDTPPLAYLQQERIARAKTLLATSALAIEQIMERIGYSDASSFRKLFRQHTGLTPNDYRERFRLGRKGSRLTA